MSAPSGTPTSGGRSSPYGGLPPGGGDGGSSENVLNKIVTPLRWGIGGLTKTVRSRFHPPRGRRSKKKSREEDSPLTTPLSPRRFVGSSDPQTPRTKPVLPPRCHPPRPSRPRCVERTIPRAIRLVARPPRFLTLSVGGRRHGFSAPKTPSLTRSPFPSRLVPPRSPLRRCPARPRVHPAPRTCWTR